MAAGESGAGGDLLRRCWQKLAVSVACGDRGSHSILFYSLCEHHSLPFFGHAYVGYIAHEQIIGLSKLTRLVRLFARRFTVQERIGQQIADTLETMLKPHGVAVYMEAHHLCTQMRGVNAILPLARTTFFRGEYDGNPALRDEFFTASGLQR